MNSKTFLKALSVKLKQSHSLFKKLAKSYVSLFLIIMLSVSSTFAWFIQREVATLNAQKLEFQSASSLRINKDDPSNPNRIIISDFYLDEASSVDGRNLYFPLGASFTGNTSEMFFRESNAGDGYKGKDPSPPAEHRSYVYKDFELKGTSSNTPVYIKSYKIQISDPDGSNPYVFQDELKINYNTNGVPQSQNLPPENCPVRLAFISDSAANPVVIDPSAQVINYVDNSDAVSLINDDGSLHQSGLKTTNADAFASYYYGNSPLFVIPGGQPLNVTLVIWLEGTLPNCQEYIGKKISVDIDIESNFAEMETIKFIDQTVGDGGGDGHWVDDSDTILACSYKDPYSSEDRYKTVIMSKSSTYSTDYTWTCKIPKKAVTDISFYRLVPGGTAEHDGTIWNAWHTSPNIAAMEGGSKFGNGWLSYGALQTTRQMTDSDGNKYNSVVYTAIHGNGWGATNDPAQRLAPGVGYWDYSGSGSGSGPGTDPGTDPGSGGGDTHSTCKLSVYLNTANKQWIEQNANTGSVMHCITENGVDFVLEHKSANRFEGSANLEVGDSITGFYLQHTSGSRTTINIGSVFEVPNKQSHGVTYEVGNDDKARVTSGG